MTNRRNFLKLGAAAAAVGVAGAPAATRGDELLQAAWV
jgi:anaerobic selenocysteine-containing dehydrogenase